MRESISPSRCESCARGHVNVVTVSFRWDYGCCYARAHACVLVVACGTESLRLVVACRLVVAYYWGRAFKNM